MSGPDTQRERQLALQVSATIPAFATRAPQTDSRFQFVWDIRRVALAAMLLAVILTGALPGGMAGASALPKLTLKSGEGQLVKLDRAATAVFVANPEIADVQVSSGKAFFVFGVKTGRTTVYAVNGSGQTIYARDIRVTHDLDAIRSVLGERFPGNDIRLTSAPNTLMVTGSVATPAEAEAIVATLTGILGEGHKVINRLAIKAPTQVNLRVRVIEVSRNIDQRLGFNWQALLQAGNFAFGIATGRDFLVGGAQAAQAIANTILLPTNEFGSYYGGFHNGDVSIDLLVDALDEEGLARTLAEPNLTAISGEVASFIAGGEFPIPVAQDGDRTTIEFKPFGVVLDFTPTVLSPDRISLTVRPEVSDLSDNGAIELNGFRIPALTVRRVESTVELASGQSLVLGGLLRQGTRDVVRKLPGVGDIPVLGALFTSTAYQKAETELLVIVTPYIVKPTSPDRLQTPLGGNHSNRALEALLLRNASDQPASFDTAGGGRLSGPVGFIY